MFSQYFRDLDTDSLRKFNQSFCGNKEYVKQVAMWKAPLEKKRLRRERKLANPPKVQEPEESGEGLVFVHDVQKGVVFPPDMENIFAVVQFNGAQHKIFKDDRIVLENFANDLKGSTIDVTEDGDSELAVG